MTDAATDPTNHPAHCPEHDLQKLVESMAAPVAEVVRQLSSAAVTAVQTLMKAEFERGRAAGLTETMSRQPMTTNLFLQEQPQLPPAITPAVIARHMSPRRAREQ